MSHQEPGSPTLVVTTDVNKHRPLGMGRWHSNVEKAVWTMWNNGWNESGEQLQKVIDTNPRAALEYANAQTVRSLMNMSNQNREKLLDHFQKADNLASARRGKAPDFGADDIAGASDEEKAAWAAKPRPTNSADLQKLWDLECDIIYADALMIRAVLQLTMNAYFRGGINLRKAWGCYWTLLQELEKDTEGKIPTEIANNIKCGAGMFYIYMSLVPGSVMTVLSAVGFSADRDLGEQLLTEVVQSNTIRSPTAAIVLLTFYLFLPTGLADVHHTLAKVKPILDKMNNMFPENSCFTAWANFYHRKLGQTGEALDMINRAVASAEKVGEIPTFLRYLQGDTLYMSLQYESALTKYNEVLELITKTGEAFAYTGQLIISIAACHTMLGQKEKAIELLKTVPKRYNPNSKQDANSPKYAERVNAEPRLLPLIGVYVLYINRDLAHMQGKYAEKLQEDLNKVTSGEDMSPPEVRAMYWLFMGVMHKISGRREEALRAWKTCRDMEGKLASDSMVLPYVYYECGEYEYRNGNLQEAKDLFDKGQSLKGPGHETLANRYNIAQKQLKKEMKKKGLIA